MYLKWIILASFLSLNVFASERTGSGDLNFITNEDGTISINGMTPEEYDKQNPPMTGEEFLELKKSGRIRSMRLICNELGNYFDGRRYLGSRNSLFEDDTREAPLILPSNRKKQKANSNDISTTQSESTQTSNIQQRTNRPALYASAIPSGPDACCSILLLAIIVGSMMMGSY
jgi:hypothetical protein